MKAHLSLERARTDYKNEAWFKHLPKEEQDDYVQNHPDTMAPPPGSSTQAHLFNVATRHQRYTNVHTSKANKLESEARKTGDLSLRDLALAHKQQALHHASFMQMHDPSTRPASTGGPKRVLH